MTPHSHSAAPTTATTLTALLVALLLWLLLTGSLDGQELFIGLLVAVVTVLLARRRSALFDGIIWSSQLPGAVLLYLGYFLRALVHANLDMARRILSPALPIRPALVQVRTELTSPLGRLLLANSITLTPGTLTVEVEDALLTIHWIDVPPDTDIDAATRAICADFERYLRGFVR